MRKIAFLLIFLLSLQTVNAIILSVTNPSNYPLESNLDVMLSILAYNADLTYSDDLFIGLDLSYPFKEITGETYEKRVGDLASLTSVYSSFRIRTYEDVPEGEYAIRVYHCTGLCTARTYKDISLQFSGTSDVRLVEYKLSNETIVPEQEFDLTLSIKNFGTGKTRDASVQVNNSLQEIIPLIFKEKPNNYFIGDLEANTTYDLTYKIMINKELTAGVYSIPVMINTPTTSFHVGNMILELSSKSEITIPLIETEPAKPVLGKSVTIIATIENNGPGNAKSVVATLLLNSEQVSANYIGEVESEDDDIAIFDIVQEKGKDYTLKITYTDDLGNHETTKTFTANYKVVIDLSWLQNIILLSVLGAGGFLIYKKKYAKKKKEK
ncbi:MAG: hypothetical protein GON13_00580 [Nanoarchaeota archaeon]|nr:hypothetical protein [Nanoarchaeota archaeon]